jgi:uncharacterized paraquat-inducible protein A
MGSDSGRSSHEDVRCLACHAVYELPVAAEAQKAPSCPRCGSSTWIAATIPIPQLDALPQP